MAANATVKSLDKNTLARDFYGDSRNWYQIRAEISNSHVYLYTRVARL